MNGTLSSVESRWHSRRVRTSVAPPAVKGTMKRTRRVGHSAAWPGVAIAIAATIARTAERMLIIDRIPCAIVVGGAARWRERSVASARAREIPLVEHHVDPLVAVDYLRHAQIGGEGSERKRPITGGARAPAEEEGD